MTLGTYRTALKDDLEKSEFSTLYTVAESSQKKKYVFCAKQQRKKGGGGNSLHLYADPVKVSTFEMSNKDVFHCSKLI